MDLFADHRDLFHTFCHLKTERGFVFDSGELAYLCHRCSGIYSAFLVYVLLAWLFRWDGRWRSTGSSYQAYISAAVLLGICGLQVFIQNFDGDSGGGGLARFLVGCGVGLALAQILCSQGLWGRSRPKEGWSPMAFVVLAILPFHAYLGSHFFTYHALSTLVGLLALYGAINLLVLEGWIKGRRPFFRSVVVVFLIALEWGFLYFMNVGRHLHA